VRCVDHTGFVGHSVNSEKVKANKWGLSPRNIEECHMDRDWGSGETATNMQRWRRRAFASAVARSKTLRTRNVDILYGFDLRTWLYCWPVRNNVSLMPYGLTLLEVLNGYSVCHWCA